MSSETPAVAGERLYRLLDLLLLALLAPPALLVSAGIALAILADSPGPVLYRCARIGRGGRRFAMLKFRKMRENAEGSSLTVHEDERFTPIGKFLASTRLDELPQLWNVLKGDMTLVGPRPEVEQFVQLYQDEYAEILRYRPGLTGPTQLRFFQESRVFPDTHAASHFYVKGLLPTKIELDLYWVRNRSLARYLIALLRTPLLPGRVALERLILLSRRTSRAQAALWATLVLSAFGLIATYASQA